MRAIRLLVYFALGVCLGGFVTLALAETQAATYGYQLVPPTYDYAGQSGSCNPSYMGPFTTVDEGCAALLAQAKSTCPTNTLITEAELSASSGMTCNSTKSWSRTLTRRCPTGFSYNTAAGACKSTSQINYCPDSTWTLEGTTCTRPNPCPDSGTGTGTNEDGVSPGFPDLYGWYDPAAATSKGGAGTYCSGGCTVAYQATVCVKSTQAGTNNCAALKTSYTGGICTGTTNPGAVTPTPAKPPCAQGEGVITMGGQVACVASGVSPDTPKVTKSSSTQTFPDGSTKITNTTTTCSGVGACSTTTTITNTAATSGPNAGGAGQAGEPGTTTDEGEESGDDEFCAKNPDLQICKGGMSEEGTQKSVLAEIKKLTTAPTDTNFADGDDFDQPLEGVDGDAAQKLIDSYKSTTDALKVGFDDQNAPKSEPKFIEILGNWFDDVPQTGCEPPEFAVAGHTLDLSGWCPTAEKISNIGAYALWFMTLVGLFVMVTGGKGNT